MINLGVHGVKRENTMATSEGVQLDMFGNYTEQLQGGEKFWVNHPEIYGGSYSESGVQLLLSQARRWRKPIDFVGDISRTSQPDFACHHHIARRPERVNTRY